MLKGEKVLLRSIEKSDINIFYDFISDEELRKYDYGYTIPPSKEYVLENFNSFFNLRKKYITIVNEKGVVVGYMTYKEAKDCCNVYSIGITIGRRFWHRGYGMDSINTLLKFLFLNRGAHKIELEVLEFNERAISCYKKCGFIEEGRKRHRSFYEGQYKDVVIMGILNDEFKPTNINVV